MVDEVKSEELSISQLDAIRDNELKEQRESSINRTSR